MVTNGKKGVSVVIASVLMIGVVVFLSATIIIWGKGFVDGKAEWSDGDVGGSCESVAFDVMVADNSGVNHSIEVLNRGNVDIEAFNFKVYFGGILEWLLLITSFCLWRL